MQESEFNSDLVGGSAFRACNQLFSPNDLLCLPQAVQVAVLPGYDLISIDAKGGFGRFTRFEKLAIGFAAGYNFNPLNVMFLLHGVSHTAYFYLETLWGLLDYRNVLLFGRIHRVCHT